MSTLPTTITSEWLLANNACKVQRLRFQKEWPKGTEITKESLTRASEMGLDLAWFTSKICPNALGHDYQASIATLMEYPKKIELLRDEYHALTRPIDDACLAEQAKLMEDYESNVLLVKTEYGNNMLLSEDYSTRLYNLIAEYKASLLDARAKYRVRIEPMRLECEAQTGLVSTEYRAKCALIVLNVLLDLYAR